MTVLELLSPRLAARKSGTADQLAEIILGGRGTGWSVSGATSSGARAPRSAVGAVASGATKLVTAPVRFAANLAFDTARRVTGYARKADEAFLDAEDSEHENSLSDDASSRRAAVAAAIAKIHRTLTALRLGDKFPTNDDAAIYAAALRRKLRTLPKNEPTLPKGGFSEFFYDAYGLVVRPRNETSGDYHLPTSSASSTSNSAHRHALQAVLRTMDTEDARKILVFSEVELDPFTSLASPFTSALWGDMEQHLPVKVVIGLLDEGAYKLPGARDSKSLHRQWARFLRRRYRADGKEAENLLRGIAILHVLEDESSREEQQQDSESASTKQRKTCAVLWWSLESLRNRLSMQNLV